MTPADLNADTKVLVITASKLFGAICNVMRK